MIDEYIIHVLVVNLLSVFDMKEGIAMAWVFVQHEFDGVGLAAVDLVGIGYLGVGDFGRQRNGPQIFAVRRRRVQIDFGTVVVFILVANLRHR